mgnify:CR=1 FL=1
MISASPLKSTNPWCIVRLLPNRERQVVAQFRSRSDADGYLQVLQRLRPSATFIVVYDLQPVATSKASEVQDLT